MPRGGKTGTSLRSGRKDFLASDEGEVPRGEGGTPAVGPIQLSECPSGTRNSY